MRARTHTYTPCTSKEIQSATFKNSSDYLDISPKGPSGPRTAAAVAAGPAKFPPLAWPWNPFCIAAAAAAAAARLVKSLRLARPWTPEDEMAATAAAAAAATVAADGYAWLWRRRPTGSDSWVCPQVETVNDRELLGTERTVHE